MSQTEEREPKRRSWLRRYVPVVATIAAALLIVLVVLPSALTLPQSNPNEVPEYAPVPPKDQQPPPQSNVSKLGLGSSSGLTTEVKPPPLPPLKGTGGNPTTYSCVAGRQTEDPLSPPCSPYFTGSNGGATYQGVSKDEIRVILYMDGSASTTTGTSSYDSANEIAPVGPQYCDADKAPNSEKKCASLDKGIDHMFLRITRAYERYLNARYQTYGRHIHFWVFFSNARDAGGRRADAADNFDKIHPFSVIDFAIFNGFGDAYVDGMARNGVLVFASQQSEPRSFYDKYDPLVWSFYPDVEHQVDQYVDWVCKKVAPYPVAHSGSGIAHGQSRKYAFYYAADPARPDLTRFQQLAIPRLKSECHIPRSTIELTFPLAGYTINTTGDPTYARLNIAQMQGAGVTTMLWLGGVDGKTEQAGDDAKYYPEVFFAGDRYMEGNDTGFVAPRAFHSQVAVVSPVMREDRIQNTQAYQAWREAEPTAPDQPDSTYAPGVYRDFFMTGMSIQVAGPRLHPTTVAEGFRAIPTIASNNPYLPACFFTNGHFCVQDETENWWDNTGTPPGNADSTGCYRMPHEGKRYLVGQWPKGDDVFVNRRDPCTAYTLGFLSRIGTPGYGG